MRPEDLVGGVQYIEGSLYAAKKESVGPSIPSSVGGAVAALSFVGDLSANAGRNSVLTFVLDAEAKAAKGAGGGAGVKALWGGVWMLDGTKPDDLFIVSEEDESVTSDFSVYWEEKLAPMQVFFPINGAQFEVPDDDERELMERHQLLTGPQALSAFAAAELPLMMNPLSVFKIEGFADAPDDPGPNLALSENRALTVGRFFETVFGTAWTGGHPVEIFKQTDKEPKGARIVVLGRGEVSNPDGDYNQADRRVDVGIRVEPSHGADGGEKTISGMSDEEFETTLPLIRKTD
jgi:hypothetical protein